MPASAQKKPTAPPRKPAAKDSPLRAIPSVDRLLRELGDVVLPRAALVAVIRRELATLRKAAPPPDADGAIAHVSRAVEALAASRIQPVINGTGIIIHTNLGRSPLGEATVQSLVEIARNYNNLEYDLPGGERGGRAAYLEHNLAVLCNAQAATVVNNCAAALVLMLRHFTRGERKQVIISRGELVQIGGGFRIPEVLESSGATLREVGATNKTSLSDYSRAINKQTALILKVHRSNFFMGGFVDSPSTEELAALARSKRVPFAEDLGSGATVATEQFEGVEHEPTPAEVIRRGVDLVCFSGDKLLGGPQAGIIAGKAKLVAALKREPFFRALRCDKLILTALQTTVDVHLERSTDVPVVKMMGLSIDELKTRAARLVEALSDAHVSASVGTGKAQIGGGTLPRSVIPSVTLDLAPRNVSLPDFAARLRIGEPPVVGYVAAGKFKLDLRTIFLDQEEPLLAAVRRGCSLRTDDANVEANH